MATDTTHPRAAPVTGRHGHDKAQALRLRRLSVLVKIYYLLDSFCVLSA